MTARFQPDRLNWPWTPEQMEALDAMLQELYEDVGFASPVGAVDKGDLLIGTGDSILDTLTIGSSGQLLRSDGTLPAWSTFTIPDTFALGDLIYGSAANILTALTIGASGKVIRSDGSTPVYSTWTIPATFAQGDLISATSTNTLVALAKDTTATRYLSNTGTSNNAAWAQVNLANGVTGALDATNGGTDQTAVATGDLLYGSATDTWSRLSAGLGGRWLRGGGAGTAPAWSTTVLPNSLTQYQIIYAANTNQMDGQIALGTSGQVLTSNGAGSVASFQTHSLLSATHGDSTASTVTRGDIVVGTGVTPTWDDLALGAAGKVLRSDGTDLLYSTFTIPDTYTTGDLVYASAANTLAARAAVAAGSVLRAAGVATAPAYSTFTIPDTFADNLIVYATGTNVLGTNSGFSYDETTLTIPGQIAFPATQSASAGANTLDDYEEGTWTPVITFTTPGDLSVVYSSQRGDYTKIGRMVQLQCSIVTTTFTHTTASGALRITGIPFNGDTTTDVRSTGTLQFQGLKDATSLSQAVIRMAAGNSTFLDVIGSGYGVANVQLTTANTTSGTQVTLVFMITYQV